MPSVLLNLVVIRSADIDRAVDFYRVFGLKPEKQRHRNGPDHYSMKPGNAVLEIYPLNQRSKDTTGVRLGFRVKSLDRILEDLKELKIEIQSPPQETEFGRVAVVVDFDGHKIELTEDTGITK